MVAAVLMLVFSTLRLGRYVALVPHAVMAGFSCGIGGMMVISQLRTIMGLNGSSNDPSAAAQIGNAIRGIPHLQLTTLLTAAVVIVFATLSSRFSRKLPAPLIGIVAAVAVASLFGWSSREVGLLPSTLPPFASFAWSAQDVYTVIPAGFGLAFVTSVNLLVTSRVVEHFRGRHKAMKAGDADRELGAYGIANLAAAVFGAPMSVGIPARSLANVQCGATTRVSNLFHAICLVVFVVGGAKVIGHIPLAALAAVTAWMGVRLMEWSTWSRLHKMRRGDALAFLLTCFAAIFANAVFAVALGCSIYVFRTLALKYAPARRWIIAREAPVARETTVARETPRVTSTSGQPG